MLAQNAALSIWRVLSALVIGLSLGAAFVLLAIVLLGFAEPLLLPAFLIIGGVFLSMLKRLGGLRAR